MTTTGRVTLVGAGPGDPELITLKGVRALRDADVVLYDRLVSKEILTHARPDAELVNVGKQCGSHSLPQEEINQLIIDYARQGKKVVRLKGGDPFIFGRGGEEADAVAAEGIPCVVIPGITAATAAGTSCGIPLTKRGICTSVTLVTGHEDPTKEGSDIDWGALAGTGGTLVLYMAMSNLEHVVSELIAAGLSGDTPAAVVTKATTTEQDQLTGPLKNIPQLIKKRGFTPPSVVIIGHVVESGPDR